MQFTFYIKLNVGEEIGKQNTGLVSIIGPLASVATTAPALHCGTVSSN